MAQPPFLNLNPEDIPKESAAWMTPIIDSINQFAKQVQYCLNGQLSFKENIKSYVKTVQIDRFPYSFKNDASFNPVGVIIIASTDVTTGKNAVPFAAAGLAYRLNAGGVVVDSIGGAVADHSYSVTFLVIG